MGSSGQGTTTPRETDVDPRGAVDVPVVLTPASKIQKNWFRNCLDKVTDFLNIFDPPRDVRPSVWCQPACGFVLTFMYLVGVIVIIVVYTVNHKFGRPPELHIEYVSPETIQDGSMDDYLCACDLPAQVESYRKDNPDTQTSSSNQRFNRCYSTDEVQNIDVLQFRNDTIVSTIINRTESGRTPNLKTLKSNYTVRWKSYELTSRKGDIFEQFGGADPIANLSQKFEKRGYVGKDGVVSLSTLVEDAFFTVPQGFIRAEVNYTCTNCPACRQLWAKYGAAQAAPRLDNSSWGYDNGWIFCYQTSGDPESNDGVCEGACRFFPTLYRPWGIAMHDFSNELWPYINTTADDPVVFFRSRLFYAFVEDLILTANETYELYFMDIRRSGVSWTEIERDYGPIKSCATVNKYCARTSICQAAAIYDREEINSDTIGIECLDSVDGTEARTQCKATKEALELELRVKDTPRLELQCDTFDCKMVQSSQITWNGNELGGGEIALSRLIFTQTAAIRYISSLCTNDYRQVFVRRDESEPTKLISIHKMTCNNKTNAKVCWMTGEYKNVTDTSWDPWRNYPFMKDEMDARGKMFACYRFDKVSYHSYMLEQIGAVCGIIGSWLLVLSCIFWVMIKTNMAARLEARWVPLENAETPRADRPQTEMSEIITGPDDEDDNTSEQNPTKQRTSYQRLPK